MVSFILFKHFPIFLECVSYDYLQAKVTNTIITLNNTVLPKIFQSKTTKACKQAGKADRGH